jgi:hypothetical protein
MKFDAYIIAYVETSALIWTFDGRDAGFIDKLKL